MNRRKQLYELRTAILTGDIKTLEEYLLQGGDPNIRGEGGENLLSTSIHENKNEMIKLLIQYNVDLEKKDSLGLTPLIQAIKYSEIETLEMLLNAGADIHNRSSEHGKTALEEAVSLYRIKQVSLLVKRGDNIAAQSDSRLPIWSFSRSDIMFNHLLKLNLDPTLTDAMERNALHWAAMDGSGKQTIRALVKKYHINPNCLDSEGNTPLILAALVGHPQTSQYLLDVGADVAHRNLEGKDAGAVFVKKKSMTPGEYEDLTRILAYAKLKAMENHLVKTTNKPEKMKHNTKIKF